MKGILEFNLDDSDDRYAYSRCNMSLNMALLLWDIDQWARNLQKYHEISGPENDRLDELRTMIHDVIDLHEILQ